MRYRNVKSGSVIDIASELNGSMWEVLDAPSDTDIGTKAPEKVPEEVQEEKPKKRTKKKESK